MKLGENILKRCLAWRFSTRDIPPGAAWPRLSQDEELPLRAELLSADQMELHGKVLAASHALAKGRAPDQLLPRLAANENALIEVCDQLTGAVKAKRRITPAGEWLLDNFYLIEEQIRTAKRHLPKGYSQGLPRLALGPSTGRPRVYDIALEIISHGDGRVDAEGLVRFIAAYQSVTALKLGELWATPIMLRLAVIENLRRVGVRIAAAWAERNLADFWADQMADVAENDPKSLILIVADMARSNPPMVSAFVAELARRLQGQGPSLSLPLTWIEQRLAESGLTIEQLVQLENQQQAADQVSVSNSIGSLRVLGAMDWREFVEALSVVEQALREDPAGIYGDMDFATRDQYRHASERIAKYSTFTEGEVAQQAISLARHASEAQADEAPGSQTGSRHSHVGYYLVDKGVARLEQAAQYRPPLLQRMWRAAAQLPLGLYLGSILLISVGLMTGFLILAKSAWLPGAMSYTALGVMGVLTLLVSSKLAVALANWFSSLMVSPKTLPRMDFSRGIPPPSRTLVVVPSMLIKQQDAEDLVDALEVRFLANRDACLHFGLLTDFADASQQTMPDDALLLQAARGGIEALNRKYASGDTEARDDIFFLFHRDRRWNTQEKIWMGYERKRGKLAELNALLRGKRSVTGEGFALTVGRTEVLPAVKYVITLDTDTELPRDAARQFVGAMSHPLNRARYDPACRRVVEGYGILQPRVAISLPGSNRSRYAKLYGGEPGLDPYTRAVSDVYQDVFGEGSFIGKGIYDVDAFEEALADRLPENRILSHDLLEGCYARSGLLSDVHLYEDFPARYSADVSRRHRWIRGDWQLAAWLLRRAPGRREQPNPLTLLSQWKLFDNLRRSLVPAALLLLLLAGWALMAASLAWTLAVLGILILPALIGLAYDLLHKPGDVLIRQHLASTARAASRQGKQLLFELACLPHEAHFSLDAVLRTLWRMHVSKRRLLSWNPSREQERASSLAEGSTLHAHYKRMWVGPVLALASGWLLASYKPSVLLVAAVFLLLWIAAPAVVWWLSRPLVQYQPHLSLEQQQFLRTVARRTWAFFDTFVGPRDHWLPPDNVQEYRAAVIAHRTSPTNIGLALLANLAAFDFGYLCAGTLITRCTNTLRSLGGLARYHGHFYNWYDTQTLQAMPPLYVSTVDSGNLAGHLLTLRAGLSALREAPIMNAQLRDGLQDSFRVFCDSRDGELSAAAAAFRHTLDQAYDTPSLSMVALQALLVSLNASVEALDAQVKETLAEVDENASENRADLLEELQWADLLAVQCREALDELLYLAPWLSLGQAPVGLEEYGLMLATVPSLQALADLDAELSPGIARRLGDNATPAQSAWLGALLRAIAEGSLRARDRLVEIDALAQQCLLLSQMEHDFLYDNSRHLLSIGYNVSDRRLDASFYDLLASEARLGCFVAIAQGQLPQESWFALGRLLTATGGEPVLLSWSGSMFEYLMPLLVMPTYDNTLLDQTCKAAVARQIEYGNQRGVPWGVSESGYNTVDVNLNYQYRAFGVPGLGLKRGLAEDLVIAPYASLLALMVAPEAACENLQRLETYGYMGPYGFFEAIDYTATRQRRGQTSAVVHSFMAHHQGMGLLALDYVLRDRPMQRRFEADPQFRAIMLLLQERVPKSRALFTHTARRFDAIGSPQSAATQIRVFTTPDTAIPAVQLLSNGRYHVMLSNAGGGYSRWKDLAVTRWREDGTRDNWGSFCYLRDVRSGIVWSNAHQPTLRRAVHYEAIFSEGRAEFRRRDQLTADADETIETHTEIVVSPEDDIELRRLRLTNHSRHRREIELTSYAEVVISAAAEDALHPAFSKLFVQTEILPEQRAILCTRRPRSLGQQLPWMLHLMVVRGTVMGKASYETDRARFLGRNRSSAAPAAMSGNAPLSGSQGSVLDPIVAIRQRVLLEPEESVVIDMVSGIAESRELAIGLIDKYQDRHLADRVFDLAWTHSQVVLRQLNASETAAQLHARLAGSILYANPSLRAHGSVLIRNRRGQSGLWGYAISGDLPIVLLQIGDAANIELVRQLVQAHAYWRLKGLAVDLVIWNEDHAGYRQQLQEQILGMIASGIEGSVIDRPGGIFVRPAEQISGEDRVLFQSVARAIITDGGGTLEEQLDNRQFAELRAPALVPLPLALRQPRKDSFSPPRRPLLLDNGLGGFSADGCEYIMHLSAGQTTPAPWANVLANPDFGTVISESGAAYTWRENAHEFRLTPWHNDPVSDISGEAIYVRDEESGEFWSPTPFPVRSGAPCLIRHGFGYSVFEMRLNGIVSELWVYVAIDAAVKFSVLKLRNESGRSRRLSVTGYVEWVLGDLPEKTGMHVNIEQELVTGALCAHNPYSNEFASRLAFFDVDDSARSFTGDRAEFIGRNGSLAAPAAMLRTRLSGKLGAGLDPCTAIQVGFELADGQGRELVFRLGVGNDVEEATALIKRFRGAAAARAALEAVRQHWSRSLTAVQVETPDPALNVLANGWLLYQTLSCRVWARSGYYQSGGAFGFRDQLQDLMALIHAEPGRVREHLLLSASRQFREGDVQHWWHPPSGRGVRTHCSDDYLWLPLAVCRYVECSGDIAVLDEPLHFLEGRAVNLEDDSYYDLPGRSADSASLYEHCVRAIRHGLHFGERGLPLMGTGDWNDGMNRVGMLGKGESVWLAFFLCEVLRRFGELAQRTGDTEIAILCVDQREQLRHNIEAHAWDGAWYCRAWFDDGTPLGSARSEECQIDSISQSWSVLSGVGDTERARRAMNAVDQRLVRRDHGLVQLLDPPFDKAALDPGYIRGYVPGVRENGGQYTHAAIWATMAFAKMGDKARAWELMNMINPVNHALTPQAASIYKVEPYVVAADVYAVSPHTGRGGWSWYTGSAGWMYRLILESLLGLQRQGEYLEVQPCIPPHWPGYTLHYRFGESMYHISLTQTQEADTSITAAVMVVEVDGIEQADDRIPLVDDQREHSVTIKLGQRAERMSPKPAQ